MTVPEQIASPREDVTPDWAILTVDILCPLCDYNLRGLVEPRCPECGHQFVWNEVLTLGGRTHPYLFEHQWHRSRWSFFKTLRGNLFPRSFWQTLRPLHSPVISRLVLYWLLVAMPVLLTFSVVCALTVTQARTMARNIKQMYVQEQLGNLHWLQAYDPQRATGFLARHGTVQAFVDATFPLPGIVDCIRRGSPRSGNAMLFMLVILAWPWFTAVAMMVFRVSMTRAKIKIAHVLRCTTYSSTSVLLFSPIAIFIVMSGTFGQMSRPWWKMVAGIHTETLLAMIIGLFAANWGLAIAYRTYLRFPHAVATIAASQIMVVLAMLKVYLLVLGY